VPAASLIPAGGDEGADQSSATSPPSQPPIRPRSPWWPGPRPS